MNYAPIRAITQDKINTFNVDGVVCLRQFFDTNTVELLREIAEENILNPSPMAIDASQGGTGRFFGDTFVWAHHPQLKEFIWHSPAANMAKEILQSNKINVIFDQFLIKDPGTSTPTLWHHDQTYWPVAGSQVATMWIALDPVTNATGAVEYIKGSHKWGKRFKAVSFKDKDMYKEDLPEVPDIAANRDKYEFIQYEMEAGDCTIHHGLALHGAPGNSSQTQKRRAYIIRWAGDDVTYDPRPNLQPMLRDPGINVGDPLDCELFPVVR
jgi:ectoine hydroxylase-related dioxygenase (phytanoyl-CoA dioxygenase family)